MRRCGIQQIDLVGLARHNLNGHPDLGFQVSEAGAELSSFACLAIARRHAESKSPRIPITADMANLPPFATLNQISDALRIPKSHLLRGLVSVGV
jgi:hypothetical protein